MNINKINKFYSTESINKLNVYSSDIFNPPITLRVASRYYISKMLKSFFNFLINEHKITNLIHQ